MWVPMAAQAPVLLPNDHRSPSQGRHKGFGKSRNFETFQVPRDNRNFGAFGGPMATWAEHPLCGSPRVLKWAMCAANVK